MRTTLVVGGSRTGRVVHATTLLQEHDRVTWIRAGADEPTPGAEEPADLPAGWQVVRTHDLTHALITARNPVLIDGVSDWLRGRLDDEDAWADPLAARGLIDGLVDELEVTALGLPYDVVLLTEELDGAGAAPGSPSALAADLLDHVNRRLSAAVAQVHVVIAGRVLDLSEARPLGR